MKQFVGMAVLCLCLCVLFSPATPAQQPDRKPTFIRFEAPGAGTGAGQGTWPVSINVAGAITGYYVDANGAYHGFVRATDGTITTFDAPSAAQYTTPTSINTPGAVTGLYNDANDVSHGFVRAANGTFTTFEAPGAGAGAGQGTLAYSIGTTGATTGY